MISDGTSCSRRDAVKEKQTAAKAARRKSRARIRRRVRRALFAGGFAAAALGLTFAFLWGGGGGTEPDAASVTIYSSPTCACCEGYVNYLNDEGFEVELRRTDHLEDVKDRFDIPADMRSCHTGVMNDYYVEGHVPVEAIRRLLQEQPDIDGIALPGMPAGSPGMAGQQNRPFTIYAIANGEINEFMTLIAAPDS